MKATQEPSHITIPESSPSLNVANAELQGTLKRLLDAVEVQQRQTAMEFVLVILLALTALASTWCAYQSQLWNGVQLIRLADADVATQHANEGKLAAMQRMSLHGTVLLHFVEALERGNSHLAENIHKRMESPMREAVDAWLKFDPLNNPSAPRARDMPEYVLPELKEAEQYRDSAREQRAAAAQAGNYGDTYVLLTLMFASVLFFGGITGTFRARRLRSAIAGVACALFLATVAWLSTMPICSG